MDPTLRFSNRVEPYARYRPGYPAELVEHLHREAGITSQAVVADLGSGTGLLTRPFLEAGHRVYGIEPNREMRLAGEAYLADFPGFESREGRSEATGLSGESVDLVTAGQAFHWFEPEATRAEIRRILRGPRLVALTWNERNRDSDFEKECARIMEVHAPDYQGLRLGRSSDETIEAFFEAVPRLKLFSCQQVFDREGLQGRFLSSSCMPAPGSPGYEEARQAIDELFDRHHSKGRVVLTYTTRLYWGRL